ncbi:MAG: hypothetical protein K0Q50_134 [Vampirovibrio sp.]|jgi:hypothetical protein|nr:hypothetical protein [Vampirovibrio sp.]
MSKKTKTSRTRKTSPDQLSQRELQKRMQLLGFMRGKEQFLNLLTEMQQTEQELAESYKLARQCDTGTPEEDDCLAHIRELEDKRFQLLGQLHGNRVNDYQKLTSRAEA